MNYMQSQKTQALDYSRPILVAEGIYWVGFYDDKARMHCNPYLIIEGEEAVVIDGGSRPDFSTVMMKIIDTGIACSSIKWLIYQHFDPDLCGSIPSFEQIISSRDLKIISQKENNIFINYYSVTSPLLCIDTMDRKLTFSSGRELRFLMTPYAHSTGSFVTFDAKTGTLFSSDLFGSYGSTWELFFGLLPECYHCKDYDACPLGLRECPLREMIDFHRKIMTSEKALRYAINQICELPVSAIAPQHGSVINRKEDIDLLCALLSGLKGVGIDSYDEEKAP
jgi:flavorubredoxin